MGGNRLLAVLIIVIIVASLALFCDSHITLPHEKSPEASYKHPFYFGYQFTIITDTTRHRSRGSGFVELDDEWLICWRDGDFHDTSYYNSTIRCADTCNNSLILENEREVYSEADCDVTDIRVWMMDDGRIGIMAERFPRLANGKADYPVFIYSDDDGATWKHEILDDVEGNISYDWIRYPASVGGDDDGGWIGFLHQSRLAERDKDIYAVYTVDNGLTWNMTRVIHDTEGLLDAYDVTDEPIIQRLGDEDKWIMMLRVELGSDSIITPLFKSTDLFTWTEPYDTGQSQRRNPSRIIYDEGYITWIAATRPYHYEDSDMRAIPVDGEIFQGLVIQTVNADELWDDPDCWTGWSELARLPHIHGDPSFWKIDGKWFGILGIYEGAAGIGKSTEKTYSQLAIISPLT